LPPVVAILAPTYTSIEIDLTLEDDEIEVLPPAPTGPPARQASTPRLVTPLPERSPLPAPTPQTQTPPREPAPRRISPEVIELDDDDVIEISSPIHQSPLRPETKPDPGDRIELPDTIIQDAPMLDINDLSLEERPPVPPPPEFPAFARQIDVPERRFGPMNGARRPGPSLPPALRAGGRTALGQKFQDALASDKLVQSLGLRGLKEIGWRTEKRDRIGTFVYWLTCFLIKLYLSLR
jgi:hypothetical protein